ALRELELDGGGLEHGTNSPEWRAENERYETMQRELGSEYAQLRDEIESLGRENARYELDLVTADGQEKLLPLAEIVRAFAPNQLGFFARVGVYLSRWREYLLDDPRES